MQIRRISSRLALAAVVASLVLAASPSGAQKQPQSEALAEALREPAAPVNPIPPAQRQKILQMKKVKHDPSANPRAYGLRHPADQNGWLVFNQATQVAFQQNYATISPNTGGVILTFQPLAVGKPHLVIFAVTVVQGSLNILVTQSGAGGTPQPTTETQTVATGQPAYVPVIVTPLANTKLVGIEIMNTPSTAKYFTFQQATVELVK